MPSEWTCFSTIKKNNTISAFSTLIFDHFMSARLAPVLLFCNIQYASCVNKLLYLLACNCEYSFFASCSCQSITLWHHAQHATQCSIYEWKCFSLSIFQSLTNSFFQINLKYNNTSLSKISFSQNSLFSISYKYFKIL